MSLFIRSSPGERTNWRLPPKFSKICLAVVSPFGPRKYELVAGPIRHSPQQNYTKASTHYSRFAHDRDIKLEITLVGARALTTFFLGWSRRRSWRLCQQPDFGDPGWLGEPHQEVTLSTQRSYGAVPGAPGQLCFWPGQTFGYFLSPTWPESKCGWPLCTLNWNR